MGQTALLAERMSKNSSFALLFFFPDSFLSYETPLPVVSFLYDTLHADAQLKEALEAVSKYPQYRQQSLEIQQKLESEIQSIRLAQEENIERLKKMEDAQMKLERNKLRDRLLQSYRFYTDKDKNPTQSWSRMEAEAFWELFGEYEERGGNGFVHSEVQPAMNRLTVIEVNEHKV